MEPLEIAKLFVRERCGLNSPLSVSLWYETRGPELRVWYDAGDERETRYLPQEFRGLPVVVEMRPVITFQAR
jgi:hypothetical protein